MSVPEPVAEWLDGMTGLELAGLTGATLAAIVAAVVAVWKGWPMFKAVVKGTFRLVLLAETLATLPDVLEKIRHEVQPNSGGSLKDIAVRTEAAVAALEAQVAVVTEDVAHVRRQAASLKTSISRTNRRLTQHIAENAGDA